jgi:hypothetical protein
MKFQDQQLPPPPNPRGPAHRDAWLAAVAAALLVVTTVAAVLVTRSNGEAAGSSSPEQSSPQPTASPTTTTIDPQTEVVARLREILRVRDVAYQQREAELLRPSIRAIAHALRETETQSSSCLRTRLFGSEHLRRFGSRSSNVSTNGSGSLQQSSKVRRSGSRQSQANSFGL